MSIVIPVNDLWRKNKLPEILTRLASRPGHESVRTLVTTILVEGFHAKWEEISHEIRLPEVRGRVDTLLGRTVFEFKSDLRREIGDVVAKLPSYLAERERQTNATYIGVATDGAEFIVYELQNGSLTELAKLATDPEHADRFLAWLEPAIAARDNLPPDSVTIINELGRDSITFRRARNMLAGLWPRLATHPEAKLKRDLWNRLLREVYGTDVGDDSLFLQHTYLTILAKTIAAGAFGLATESAQDILSGKALAEIGIRGAVESDFFDWVELDPAGGDLVERLARQTQRFDLTRVEVDVMKLLYESLIDPESRHDLGEYYTPDWLAAKLVKAAIPDPLHQKILDPACGSGTFLFHAIRHILKAAKEAGLDDSMAVARCMAHVQGLDVHPVAVIFARVTWLLALGETIEARPANLTVPVYLGDALQWNVLDVGLSQELRIEVPGSQALRIPVGFAEDQDRFEAAVHILTDGLEHNHNAALIKRLLGKVAGCDGADTDILTSTYAQLDALNRDGRDGIWPYVLRNLRRPLVLSRPSQRADVVIGNPPWVAYRFLSPEIQLKVSDAAKGRGIWVGGSLASQFDLSALFFVRALELYLKPNGTIAFVMPYAALNRPAFGNMRKGTYAGTRQQAQARIVEAWSFDEKVKPLFPVPACVLIARRADPTKLPTTVARYAGNLYRRNATEAEAELVLRVDRKAPWPPIPTLAGASPYRARFQDGATIYPRRFFFIERVNGGRLGPNKAAPMVRGKTGSQDKAPWKHIPPPQGPVEAEFLRDVILGENLAPFRVLGETQAVVPIYGRAILNSDEALYEGHRRLAAWLRHIEALWADHGSRNRDGEPKMTLGQQLDYRRKLSAQLAVTKSRVVYAESGTLPAAAVVTNPSLIIQHAVFWAELRSDDEGHYLAALINAEAVRLRVVDRQAKGQGGARHFDNLFWELRIPEYSAREKLHQALAAAGRKAEAIAAGVPIDPDAYFTTSRKLIREALKQTGIAGEIDKLVNQLLA